MSFIVKIFTAIIRIALVVVGFMVGGALGAFIGSVIGGFIAKGIESLLLPKSGTKTEAASVNVRIAEPIRWINAGQCKQGGAVVFADFTSNGDLWYVLIHSDSILQTRQKLFLDDIEVTTDGSGAVLTKNFRLNSKNEPVAGDGQGETFVWVWTSTYTESNVVPPAISQLNSAFPSRWTSDHKLVGTTFSVVRMRGMKAEDRYKMFKWRGALGLGEPSVAILGDWSHCFDPRDNTQTNNVPTTYKFSRNSVIVWAWFRTHRYGRNKSRDSINWSKVAEQAAICDQTVTGLVGDHVRYKCDASIPEDQMRVDAENLILMTMDAQLVFDDDGKCWPRVGYYYAPSLALTRNRDIVAMESVEAQNGESETQGVIIRYVDPASNYTVQPSAAWLNPNYYVAGQSATFAVIDCPFIQDHNQAMRIAKAVGLRFQPPYKLAPTVGLRGLKATKERILSLQYDNTFTGDHEIATQVELDQAGVFCSFGIVPVDNNRWNLLAGEEKPKPVSTDNVAIAGPSVPTGVTVTFVNNRIEASFAAPARYDVGYEFQYIKTSDISSDNWAGMTTEMTRLFSYSGVVDPNNDYSVRYRSVAASGIVSNWSSNVAVTVGSPGANLQFIVFSSWIVEVAAGTPVITITSGGVLTISNNTRRYNDGHADVAVTGATISTGLAVGDFRAIGYDDTGRAGGAVTYQLYAADGDAHASTSHPGRHYVGFFYVPATGTGNGGGGAPAGSFDPGIDWGAYLNIPI